MSGRSLNVNVTYLLTKGSLRAESSVTASLGKWVRRATILTIWFYNQDVFTTYDDGGMNVRVNATVNVSECDRRMKQGLTVTDVKRSATGRGACFGLKHLSRRIESSWADVVRYHRSGFPTRTFSQRIATAG